MRIIKQSHEHRRIHIHVRIRILVRMRSRIRIRIKEAGMLIRFPALDSDLVSLTGSGSVVEKS